MAGQIAHNFDEEDGWMISVSSQEKMKCRIHTSRKGTFKKKKSLMQNLHPAIKQGRTQDAEDPSVSSARLSKNTSLALGWTRLFAFRRFLSGPDNPDICNYTYQFVFKLSGCREESTPCWEEAARCFGAAALRCAATTHSAQTLRA